MEREILFRGKRIDSGEWVYGSFIPDALEMLNGFDCMDGFIRRYNPETRKPDMFEVERDTVGQYIGLTDENGVKIFEGDILQCEQYFYDPCKLDDSYSKFMLRGVVVYDETGKDFPPVWNIQFKSKDGCLCKYLFNQEFEVIGNIHDNPELLKVDTLKKCCRTCEYWAGKYNKCEHPYQTESDSYAYMAPPDKVCELYESATE